MARLIRRFIAGFAAGAGTVCMIVGLFTMIRIAAGA